ncbi:MAG TPA: MFS transporter, partial [Planctomycetaceae bacterium]|nr:MFS transporter [Planctomycetaceae bacterium]
MDYRNRIGLYGTYLCATAGIGFTLPYLPLYLGQQGLSDRTIGWICSGAALAGLAQFPIGLWSDRRGTRKPFLVVALVLLTLATMFLEGARGALLVGFLVTMFAENGICRAVVESLAGAEVACLAPPGERGAALGALRLWKPIGIIGVALFGSWWAEKFSVESILAPLTAIQLLGVFAASLIHEPGHLASDKTSRPAANKSRWNAPRLPRDPELWTFVLAMILFHVANAPGGVYLGLFLKRGLGASESWLAYAFIAEMLAWMVVVWPAGWMADRIGRRPLLILTWALMALRLLIVALARTPGQIVINQVLDGVANGLFSVLAATWVADRLADSRRAGEAQVIVGTSLVFGSALGPMLAAAVVDAL